MKKLLFVQMLVVCLLLSAAPVFASDSVSNKTAIYLMNESNKVMSGLDTYNMAMELDGKVSMRYGDYNMDSEFILTADAVFDMDKGLYAEYQYSIAGDEPFDMHVYMSNDSVYGKYPFLSDEWVSIDPSDGFSRFAEMLNTPYVEMTHDSPYDGKFQYKKNAVIDGKDYYVVTCRMEAKELIELYRNEVFSDKEDDLYFDAEEMMLTENIINGIEGYFTLRYYINKDTMAQEYYEMVMDGAFNYEESGEQLSMSMMFKITSHISDINKAIMPQFQ